MVTRDAAFRDYGIAIFDPRLEAYSPGRRAKRIAALSKAGRTAPRCMNAPCAPAGCGRAPRDGAG